MTSTLVSASTTVPPPTFVVTVGEFVVVTVAPYAVATTAPLPTIAVAKAGATVSPS